MTQGQISFHSLDHDTSGKRGVKNVSFLDLPYRLSLPILPSHLELGSPFLTVVL